MRTYSFMSNGARTHTLGASSYRIGEAFIHLPHPRAMKRLERDLKALNAELDKQTTSAQECEKQMKALKVTLYAKFGRAINLDE